MRRGGVAYGENNGTKLKIYIGDRENRKPKH